MSVINALFTKMGKVIPYFKMTPELAQDMHSTLAKVMMYAKSKGIKLSQKQQDYIINQTKQLDLYEKSLTPATPKGPKADVIDLSKKLPEDAPYSEKNPTGWMEGEMIVRMKKQNKDAVKRLKEKKKTKTAEEIIDEGDFDPSGMKDGGRIGYAKGGLNYLMGL